MKRDLVLKHEFVEFIPDKLEDGIVYVSIRYATVAHKCCCGCGTEVVTPLAPRIGNSFSTARRFRSTRRSETGVLPANRTIGFGATR